MVEPDPPDDAVLTHILARIAATLVGDRTLEDDLERLVRLVTDTVPGCSGASVALLVQGEPRTVAASDRVTVEADLVQYRTGEGPCLAALDGHAIRVGLVGADERFPHFAVGAADLRVQSVLSVPATYGDQVVGTLNMYAGVPEAFDGDAEDLGRVFAAEVGAVVASSRLYRDLERASQQLQEQQDERAVVSVAQGVLMSLYEVSAGQALALIQGAADANTEAVLDAARRILAQAEKQPPVKD
jgi:GAF domain-containing protein